MDFLLTLPMLVMFRATADHTVHRSIISKESGHGRNVVRQNINKGLKLILATVLQTLWKYLTSMCAIQVSDLRCHINEVCGGADCG